jgi:hypothetical protein
MPPFNDPMRKPGRKYFEDPTGGGATDLASNPAINTFQGKPVDMSAGDRLPVVPSSAMAQTLGTPQQPEFTPTPARQPFEIANDAGTMVNNAVQTATSRINSANNPMSDDAETMRRLEIAQGGFKGSPSSRQAVSAALLGQLGGVRQAALAGISPTAAIAGQAAGFENQRAMQGVDGQQRMALQELVGGQQTGIEAMRQAGDTSRNTANNTAAIDVAKIGRNPVGAYQKAADGTLALVEGAQATAVTGADGQPFNAAANDGITAKDRFDAYQLRAKAIEAAPMTPEQKNAQMQALQQSPEFASLFAQPGATGNQPASAPKNAQDFIAAARAKGSKLSDAELTAYYTSKYAKSSP